VLTRPCSLKVARQKVRVKEPRSSTAGLRVIKNAPFNLLSLKIIFGELLLLPYW